jgi:bile acid:Na+ symporter, BASS family
MTVEQLILILLQATLFTSALNLGFGATRFELSFLFRRPGLFARTFLAMYVVVPVVTAVILILVPLPAGVKTAVILLSISPIAITLPFKMEARGQTQHMLIPC